MNQIGLVPLVVLLVALGGGEPDAAAMTEMLTETFEVTHPLAPDGEVSLEVLRGDVRVEAWDREEVRIRAVKQAGLQVDLDLLEIAVAVTPQRIGIETEYPGDRSRGKKRSKKTRPRVDYVLTVPRQSSLVALEMHKGDLEIVGVEGGVGARGTNGDITLRGVKGVVRVSSGAGRIDYFCDGLGSGDWVELTSSLGPVVLHLLGACSAAVHASTSGGWIQNRINPIHTGQLRSEIVDLPGGGKELRTVFGLGHGTIRVNTFSGPISIEDQ